MKPIGRKGGQRGVTLIELLAALLITGFIVAIASRIFISGNRQFLLRSSESHSLEQSHRVKSVLQAILKREVEKCASGSMELKRGSDPEGSGADGEDVAALLKTRVPELESAAFRCLETDREGTSLVEWMDGFQPGLIEYRLILDRKGKRDTLAGSWVK
jgi:prepilin-type N-terminal cleavage/methylation domain-containing protein